MAATRTIKVDGQDVAVKELDFAPIAEPWAEIKLTDGGLIRARITISRVFVKVDAAGRPMLTPDGYPDYILNHATQIVPVR